MPAAIESGTRLRTAGDGRAALRLASGIELRLDARTLVALNDGSHATLANGAVYVDAGEPSGTPGPEFDLATPAGTLSHLGTQYTARIADHGVLVGVREGRVRLSTDQGDVIGSAGERTDHRRRHGEPCSRWRRRLPPGTGSAA